jgi:hypothetical protein
MKREKKKGLSLMVSYVLLIVIAISLSVGVYSWIRFIIKGQNPIDKCPDGVSLVIQDYTLLAGNTISLTVKNKGLFSINGYYIKGTANKSQVSSFNLKDPNALEGALEGTHSFLPALAPNKEDTHVFSYEGLDQLEKIEIEPFRIQEKSLFQKKTYVLCDQAVVSQEISS